MEQSQSRFKPTLTVRNLDEALVRKLSRRAKADGCPWGRRPRPERDCCAPPALDIGLAVDISPHDAFCAAFALRVGADHVVAADQALLSALRRHPDPAVSRLALDLRDWAARTPASPGGA